MKPVVCHIQVGDWFRVCMAVIIREFETHFDGKRQRCADLMVFCDGRTFFEFNVQHYKDLISASYWVEIHEIPLMENDLLRDHGKRGLSKVQLADLETIKGWLGK